MLESDCLIAAYSRRSMVGSWQLLLCGPGCCSPSASMFVSLLRPRFKQITSYLSYLLTRLAFFLFFFFFLPPSEVGCKFYFAIINVVVQFSCLKVASLLSVASGIYTGETAYDNKYIKIIILPFSFPFS